MLPLPIAHSACFLIVNVVFALIGFAWLRYAVSALHPCILVSYGFYLIIHGVVAGLHIALFIGNELKVIRSHGRFVAGRICIFVVLLAYLAAVIGIDIWILRWTPIFAWDALSTYRGWLSFSLIYLGSSPEALVGEAPFWVKHPLTVSMIAALSSGAAQSLQLDALSGALFPWLGALLCMGGIVFSVTQKHVGSSNLGLLMCAITTSIPLLENHALIPGYAEIWLALALTLSVAFIIDLIDRPSIVASSLTLTSLATLMLFKNTGILYLFCALLGIAMGFLHRQQGLKRYLSPAVCIICLTIALGGLVASITPIAGWTCKASWSGMSINLRLNDFSSVLHHASTALFINASFGFLPLAAGFSLVTLTRSAGGLNTGAVISSAVGVGGLVLYLLLITGTDVGFAHSGPGFDTGGSRLLIPLIGVWVISLATQLASQDRKLAVQRDQHRREKPCEFAQRY